MKVSLHWLRRFVDFDLTATELAEKLTMRGFESEVVSDFDSLENLVVGDVLTAEKHPDADKLKLCSVSDGLETFSVVCGAPNVDAGQKIVFAKVGAVLPGDFKIGKAKIRGVESFGMICSERELGISEEHDGIMVLDESHKAGTPIKEVLGPLFNAIDIEVTPDKAFALSHRGIAREVATIVGSKLKTPINSVKLNPKSKDIVSVEWVAWIDGVGGSATDNQKNLQLNASAAAGQNSSQFRTSDSTTITVRDTDSNGNNKVNRSGDDYIAYVFSSVEGYSKFGSYVGNGNSSGTFVFLGFRPTFLIVKATGLTESWYLYDNKRNTFNAVDKYLRSDNVYAEGTFVLGDLLSNGFKIRQTDSALNTNGQTYIYLAFAEAPFKNARAR